MWKPILSHGIGRSGYSLIELVVVLSLLVLGAALFGAHLAAPSRGLDAAAAAREMLLCLRGAGWRAVVSGNRRRLATFSRKGDRALWYVIEKQEGTVWIPEGDGHRIPEGIGLRSTGAATKVFNPNGTSSIGSILLEAPGGKSYRLSLNPLTGRVRLYRGDQEVGRDE